jgi:hypothetical protein
MMKMMMTMFLILKTKGKDVERNQSSSAIFSKAEMMEFDLEMICDSISLLMADSTSFFHPESQNVG